MAKAIWKGQVLAESDRTVVVEGNVYFPADSIHSEFFEDSPNVTYCPWKGQASYYDVVVDGDSNQAAAWTYRDPSPAARQIKDYVAFWRGVHVER